MQSFLHEISYVESTLLERSRKSGLPHYLPEMRTFACCLLLHAALPVLVLASLGVDVSVSVSQSQFSCMKGQGYTFAMCVFAPIRRHCPRIVASYPCLCVLVREW